jgi:serine phosphatase RsbU (regulator of sigma subunit)/pSer/pThr/pTyr-binding forkhead associated (FHA) protein/CheY-like chemotaxis protein
LVGVISKRKRLNMDETYSILLAVFKAAEESFASLHFSQSGHRIVTADSIFDAVEKLQAQKIDLIYFQASADNTTVHEIEEIHGRFPALPIVLACARSAEGLVLDAWHAGATDILFFPLVPRSLEASLQRSARRLAVREPEQQALPMQARFFFLDETGNECRASIFPPRFTMGRGHGNDLILGQMGVSRSHAEVLVQNSEYLLRDLSSKQGTYLNGIRVEQAKLVNGDKVQLGGLQGISLIFHEGDLLQSLLGASDPKSEISLSVHGFREVGMLFAAFRALSSIPVLDDLLALVVDTAIELSGAERGFIMLKEQSGDLSFRCARNDQKCTLDGSVFQTSHRVPYDVFKTGQPVVIKDLDLGDQPEDHSATRRLGLRSISCVPLQYFAVHDSENLSRIEHAETIGVLYVDSSNVGAGPSNMRVDALKTLATEAAMAIYNARLYKDSQDKRRMEEQLATAREIQQALLPNPNKDLPYVRACSQSLPCHEVGGDYFDYFSAEEKYFGFALGDVAGKGMPAALLASLIQGVLSAQTLFDTPLPAMISNVNQILAQRGTGSRFVTFFFGTLDPDGNCEYVNAGHNPPILISPDGSMRELTVGGVVLGLFAGAQYEAGTVKLHPDDHLVLFTDGVVEALNSADEEFGMERLTALLRANARAAAPEILARLRDSVLAFSATAPQHDDITMMILGFRESQDHPRDS